MKKKKASDLDALAQEEENNRAAEMTLGSMLTSAWVKSQGEDSAALRFGFMEPAKDCWVKLVRRTIHRAWITFFTIPFCLSLWVMLSADMGIGYKCFAFAVMFTSVVVVYYKLNKISDLCIGTSVQSVGRLWKKHMLTSVGQDLFQSVVYSAEVLVENTHKAAGAAKEYQQLRFGLNHGSDGSTRKIVVACLKCRLRQYASNLFDAERDGIGTLAGQARGLFAQTFALAKPLGITEEIGEWGDYLAPPHKKK